MCFEADLKFFLGHMCVQTYGKCVTDRKVITLPWSCCFFKFMSVYVNSHKFEQKSSMLPQLTHMMPCKAGLWHLRGTCSHPHSTVNRAIRTEWKNVWSQNNITDSVRANFKSWRLLAWLFVHKVVVNVELSLFHFCISKCSLFYQEK